MDYYRKYLKYKEKYLSLKAQLDGGLFKRNKSIKPALLLKQKRIINDKKVDVDVITDINIDRIPNGALQKLNNLKDKFIKEKENLNIDCTKEWRVKLIKKLCYTIKLLEAICNEITSNIVLNMKEKDRPINIKSTYTKKDHELDGFKIREGIDIPQYIAGGHLNIWIGINFSDEWKVNFIPLTPKDTTKINLNYPPEDKFNIIKSICEIYDDYILEYKKNNIVYFTITTTKSIEGRWNKISYEVKLNTEKFLVPS
jgi:hypothetical protein